MKLIICGSRGITDYNILVDAVRHYNIPIKDIEYVISGGAPGADRLGERFAKEHIIKLVHMKPEWGKYGKSAGVVCNLEMLKRADTVIALWDGESMGTKHMIEAAKRSHGIKLYVIKLS